MAAQSACSSSRRDCLLLLLLLLVRDLPGAPRGSRPSPLKRLVQEVVVLSLAVAPLKLSLAQRPPPQRIVRLLEQVSYIGEARFLGVTPPQVNRPLTHGATGTRTVRETGTGTATRDTGEDFAANTGFKVSSPRQRYEAVKRRNSMANGRLKLSSSSAQSNTTQQLPVTKGKPQPGFDGIDVFQVRYSGQGPVFYDAVGTPSPPDASLCVGNGFVVQVVNTAISVTDYTGKRKAGILSLAQFLGLFPYIINYPPGSPDSSSGDFLTDPSCAFDKETGRFFLSVAWAFPWNTALLDLGQVRYNPVTKVTFGAGTIVAVSDRDPTRPWKAYFIPGTNDGFSSNNDTAPPLSYPGPSILQDYPQLGVDAYGVYIVSMQYASTDGSFCGANIYVIPKRELIGGQFQLSAVRFALPYDDSVNTPTAIFSIVPAKTPADGEYDRGSQGTMYLGTILSTPEDNTSPNMSRTGLGLWTIRGTSTLNCNQPNLSLNFDFIPSPPYPYAPDAVPQKDGPIPIGKSLNQSNVLGLVESNAGSNLIGCAWAGGKVWYSFSRAYSVVGSDDVLTGVVVASVTPRAPSQAQSSAVLDTFNTFGTQGNHLLFPSISLNRNGRGIVAFALCGNNFYPTSAYTAIDSKGNLGDSIFVAAPGSGPLDSFEGYNSPGEQGVMRFGDWHTVVVDEKGDAWASVEYVSGKNKKNNSYSNWGTSIFRVKL